MNIFSFLEKFGDKILTKFFKINKEEEKARYISAIIDTPEELKLTETIWAGLTEEEKKEVLLHNFETVTKSDNAEAGLVFILFPLIILCAILKYYL